LKEAQESFAKPGDVLLGDGGMSERKLVTIVLAFQRWRHIQLKVCRMWLILVFSFFLNRRHVLEKNRSMVS
jgi:hypothetical protein